MKGSSKTLLGTLLGTLLRTFVNFSKQNVKGANSNPRSDSEQRQSRRTQTCLPGNQSYSNYLNSVFRCPVFG